MSSKPTLSDELAIRFSGVGKDYRIRTEGAWSGDLRNDVRSLVRTVLRRPDPDRPSMRSALESISFDVERGETLALIGANGAGKSTCLKIISMITRPTRGEVLVRGRVAALISLGAGFHRELNGRENVYLYGAILGLRRSQIDERYQQIVDFAELGDFMATPIKYYSNGMNVRLGFSVAVHVDADILLVDEVLSVGDAAFRAKSAARLAEILSHGEVTTIMVSHDADLLRQHCARGIYIGDGKVAYDGELGAALETYHEAVKD